MEDNYEIKFKKCEKDLLKANHDLDKLYEKYDLKTSELRDRIRELESMNNRDNTNNDNEKVRIWIERYENLNREHDELLENNKDITVLLDTKEKYVSELKQRIRNLLNRGSNLNIEARRFETLNEEKESLERNNNNLKTILDEKERNLSQLKQRIRDLEASNNRNNTTNTTTESEYQKKYNETLEKNLNLLKENYKLIEKNRNETKRLNDEKAEQFQKFTNDLFEKTNEIGKLKVEIVKLNGELNKNTRSNDTENRNLKKKYNDLAKEYNDLIEYVNQLQDYLRQYGYQFSDTLRYKECKGSDCTIMGGKNIKNKNTPKKRNKTSKKQKK